MSALRIPKQPKPRVYRSRGRAYAACRKMDKRIRVSVNGYCSILIPEPTGGIRVIDDPDRPEDRLLATIAQHTG